MPKAKKVNKKRKQKIRKDNIIILILSLTFISLVIWLVSMASDVLKSKEPVKEMLVIDKIDKYDYYLSDTDTKYYKELFNELKDILNSEEVIDEEYAIYVAKLFTVDFYDLNSKISKNDVGGVQFISKDYQDNFIKTATNAKGIYYYVKSDLYQNRKQELPIVTNVDLVSTKNIEYSHVKIEDDNAYMVTLDINYKKDLGYPKSVTLTLVHNNSKIEIVEVK